MGERCSTICALRAIPGVEWVDRTHYRRTVAIGASQKGDVHGWIAVSLAKGGAALEVEMSPVARAGDRRGDRARSRIYSIWARRPIR